MDFIHLMQHTKKKTHNCTWYIFKRKRSVLKTPMQKTISIRKDNRIRCRRPSAQNVTQTCGTQKVALASRNWNENDWGVQCRQGYEHGLYIHAWAPRGCPEQRHTRHFATIVLIKYCMPWAPSGLSVDDDDGDSYGNWLLFVALPRSVPWCWGSQPSRP